MFNIAQAANTARLTSGSTRQYRPVVPLAMIEPLQAPKRVPAPRSVLSRVEHDTWSIDNMWYDGFQGLASKYMNSSRAGNYKRLREVFTSFDWNVDYELVKEMHGHTHGLAAAHRRELVLKVKRFLMGSTLRPYWEQMSEAQLAAGEIGSSLAWWVKDLPKEVRNDPRPYPGGETDCLVMVDSEYYVERFEQRLAYDNVPVILITEDVTKAAGAIPNGTFTFNSQGQIVVQVNGGSVYKHTCYDWHREEFMATSGRHSTAYHIERRSISPGKQVVMLFPIWHTSSWLKSRVANTFLESQPLQRFDPRVGDWIEIHNAVNTEEHPLGSVSIARQNCLGEVTVPTALHEVCKGKAIRGKMRTSTGQLKPLFLSSNVNISTTDLELYAAFLESITDLEQTYVRSVGGARTVPVIQTYTSNKQTEMLDRPLVEPFGQPVTNPPLTMLKEDAAALDAVYGRIIKVASHKKVTHPQLKHIEDFVHALFGDSEGKVAAVDFSAVFEKQDSPTQQQILWDAYHGVYPDKEFRKKYTTFVKKEVYNTTKDSRPITITPGSTKLPYSAYCYALANEMKERRIKSYGFGIRPAKVARRLASALLDKKFAIMTDLSRWDGRVSQVLRQLEAYIIRYTSPTDELARNMKCWYSSVGATVTYRNDKTYCDFEYTTGYSRTSGSPETSLFNTLGNMFIGYLAVLIDHPSWSPAEAVNHLVNNCMFGGDDGVMAEITAAAFNAAAFSVGAVATSKEVYAGELGVEFLARRYGPNIMYGGWDATNSMCDIRRQLSKLFTSANLHSNVSAISKLWEKCYSYFQSDPNTPIMGELVRAVLAVSPERPANYAEGTMHLLRGIRSYCTRDQTVDNKGRSSQYPNHHAGWMDTIVKNELPTFDRGLLSFALDVAKESHSLWSFLCLPLCEEPNLVLSTDKWMVDGEQVLHPHPESAVSNVEAEKLVQHPAVPDPQGQSDTLLSEVVEVPPPTVLKGGYPDININILSQDPNIISTRRPPIVRGTDVTGVIGRAACAALPPTVSKEVSRKITTEEKKRSYKKERLAEKERNEKKAQRCDGRCGQTSTRKRKHRKKNSSEKQRSKVKVQAPRKTCDKTAAHETRVHNTSISRKFDPKNSVNASETQRPISRPKPAPNINRKT